MSRVATETEWARLEATTALYNVYGIAAGFGRPVDVLALLANDTRWAMAVLPKPLRTAWCEYCGWRDLLARQVGGRREAVTLIQEDLKALY